MSWARSAETLPPAECCVCLTQLFESPAWESSGLLVCNPCCAATLWLVTTGAPDTLATIWDVDSSILRAAIEDRPVETAPETMTDLAGAYSDMGLASDAVVEAIAAVRHDHLLWGIVLSVLLGTQLHDPEFTAALRTALRAN